MNREDPKFRVLYAESHKELHAYVHAKLFSRGLPANLTEDIIQAAYERLWARWYKNRHKSIKHLKCWLYKCVKYIVMETERTEYTGLHENIDDYVFFLEDPGGITEMIDDILWEQIVHEIYKEFSPREAFVFDAILRKRKTHREIAEELHVPTNTVTSIMRRIRLKCIKIRDEQKKSVIGQVIEDK